MKDMFPSPFVLGRFATGEPLSFLVGNEVLGLTRPFAGDSSGIVRAVVWVDSECAGVAP
jgi:hypothetical protein